MRLQDTPISDNIISDEDIIIRDVENDGDIRFVPGMSNQSSFCGIAHHSRYSWVKRFLKPHLDVLDYGCGSGYGAYEISVLVRHCDAVDISNIAIEYARGKYKRENLKYYNADLTGNLDLTKQYDLIVSFDVLEHVGNYRSFFENASALLKENGTFICGTPNKLQTLRWNKDWNPHHIKEWEPEELEDELGYYFRNVEIIGQDIKDYNIKLAIQKYLTKKSIKDYIPAIIKRLVRFVIPANIIKQETVPLSIEDITFVKNAKESFGLIAICSKIKGIDERRDYK